MSLEAPEPMNIDEDAAMAPESPEPSRIDSPPLVDTPLERRQETTSPTKSNRTMRSQKQHKHSRLFRDAIAFEIPLEITADVGVAMKRTRDGRIRALQQAFPSLAPATKQQLPADKSKDGDMSNSAEEKKVAGESIMDDEDERNSQGSPDASQAIVKKKKKQSKPLSIMPQRNEFGNMLDYLEAKYVQGVMLDEADNAEDLDDEGAGSVYSETSFLDDTDLRRTVAEQVLAHTTTTKVELMQEDAEEFFVNVGTLEVEETELTHDKYDPLKDVNAPPKKRKRPSKTSDNGDAKSVASNKSSATANGKKKQAAAAAASGATPTDGKATSTPKSPTASVASSKVAKKKPKVVKDVENQKPNTTSKKAPAADQSASDNHNAGPSPAPGEGQPVTAEDVSERKAKAMHFYEELVGMIKGATPEELPRRITSVRVSITCPPDKNPGDAILFHNPHVPGQKLKVKIPKNTKPGGTFKVSVPTPKVEEDDGVDHNKLSRTFYDTLDDYTRACDEWYDAEGLLQRTQGNKYYPLLLMKRQKFDDLMKVFPSDLKTPVDSEYMRKLLRRARQNRSKREKNSHKGGSPATKGSVGTSKSKEPAPAATKSAETQKPKPVNTSTAAQPPKETTPGPTVSLPALSSHFATKDFSLKDFERVSAE